MDVVDCILLEILKTKGLTQTKKQSKFSCFLAKITFLPCKWDESEGKLKPFSPNYLKLNIAVPALLSLSLFINSFFKIESFEYTIIRVFICFWLIFVSYLMYFQIKTGPMFCNFVNGTLNLKTYIDSPRQKHKNYTPFQHQQNKVPTDVIVVCTKLFCKTLSLFPVFLLSAFIMIPDSAFNLFEALTPLLSFLQISNPIWQVVMSKCLLALQLVGAWILYTSVVPAKQLTASARLIFPFMALKHNSLLIERF